MSSRARASVTISLAALAEHGGKSAPHKDGWGIAFYDDEDARIIRDTVCATQSRWVDFVEHQEIRSNLVVAHIRLATTGSVAIKNTQPFARELSGRMHVFAHNGHLPDLFEASNFVVGTYRPIGETDSEFAFCALLERLKPLWSQHRGIPGLADRLDVVAEFARQLGEIGLANFLYCDSDVLFAHGHRRKHADGEFKAPGLHFLRRECSPAGLTTGSSGVSLKSPRQKVVLVASVPLTTEAWVPFLENEVIAFTSGEVADRRVA